ncbi:sensor histidine kinase [Glutamicibacter sp.]|uniref:sensor histidine kinase n=1 Tax=Glutamicibacter sp. TaxID=1931995 RepID=UPI002FE24C11
MSSSNALSLRTRLITALMLVILVVTGIATLWAFQRAQLEAKEAQDGLLTRVSQIMDSPGAGFAQGEPSDAADESSLTVEILGAADGGHWLDANLSEGLQTVETSRGEQRVYVRTLADGQKLAVAQATAVRQDAVNETLISTLAPILISAPLMMVLVWLVVSWALRPVDKLRKELAAREDGSLDPLPEHRMPAEIAGFIQALEEHHSRAATVLEEQQRFAAEAAHELRTPIAAVSFQAEHLVAARNEQERSERGSALTSGLERLRGLCEQLLIMGQPENRPDTAVPLGDIARSVAQNLMVLPESEDAEVSWDLDGCESESLPEIAGRIVIQNLVHNAIRYARDAGPIEICAQRLKDTLVIQVQDHGPGIKEPSKAVAAFHREAGQHIPGSGLGLAITNQTVARLGGKLELLSRSDGQSGTCAVITLPR